MKLHDPVNCNKLDERVVTETCIQDAGETINWKLPDLIRYYELDERVSIENYLQDAVKIEYDEDIFYEWIDLEGTEQLDDEFRYYQEIAESHLRNSIRSDYYRGTWVLKSLYTEVQNLRMHLKIPLSTGTLCMLVIVIRQDFKHIRSVRIGNTYTNERWEFLKYLKALHDIVHSDVNATSIEIKSCKKEVLKVQFPKYLAEEVLSAFESPVGSKNYPFLIEYFYERNFYRNYKPNPAELKRWFERSRRDVILKLNNLLIKSGLTKNSRHLAIDQILAIAGVENHKKSRAGNHFYGKNRDTINRKIRRLLC